MFEMTEADVTPVAKQAANVASVMTMVQMKITTSARVNRPATGALSILCSQHFFVPAERDTVTSAKGMIFSRARVSVFPSLSLFGNLLLVLQSPVVVAFVPTAFAVYIKAVECSSVAIEFVSRLSLVTAGAKLIRRIGKGFLNHVVASQYRNVSALLLPVSQ